MEQSRALHRPLRRIRTGLALGQVVILIIAAWLLRSDGPGDRLDDAGPWARSIVGAAAVVVAVRLPEVVAARRVGGIDSVEPVDTGPGLAWPTRMAATVLVPLVVLAVVARYLLGPITDARWGWLVVVALTAAVIGVTVVATNRRARGAAGVEVPPRWRELVARSGLEGGVSFGALVETGPEGSPAPNACAMGVAGGRWILVDPALAARSQAVPPETAGPSSAPSGAPATPVGDFIVAHELAHLARRHPQIQLVLHGLVVAAGLGAVTASASLGWPLATLDLAPDDPIALPATALLAVAGATMARLPTAWVLRALERVADGGAADLVGVPERAAVRGLHLAAGGELSPPWLSMLLAVRPAPAQRLEYLERRR